MSSSTAIPGRSPAHLSRTPPPTTPMAGRSHMIEVLSLRIGIHGHSSVRRQTPSDERPVITLSRVNAKRRAGSPASRRIVPGRRRRPRWTLVFPTGCRVRPSSSDYRREMNDGIGEHPKDHDFSTSCRSKWNPAPGGLGCSPFFLDESPAHPGHRPLDRSDPLDVRRRRPRSVRTRWPRTTIAPTASRPGAMLPSSPAIFTECSSQHSSTGWIRAGSLARSRAMAASTSPSVESRESEEGNIGSA